MPTTGEIGRYLNVTSRTIINWVERYDRFFSDQARKENRNRRTFTEDDLLVLASIAKWRADNFEMDEIEKRLEAGEREKIELGETFGIDARMVPAAAVEQMIDASEVRFELERITAERDKLLEMLSTKDDEQRAERVEHKTEREQMQRQIDELRERAIRAETLLEYIQQQQKRDE